MHLSLFSYSPISVTLFSLVLLLDVFFFSVSLAIHVYLTCPPIHVASAFINVIHPQRLSPSASLIVLSFYFLTPEAKSMVIHPSQSLNMIYCNMIIS